MYDKNLNFLMVEILSIDILLIKSKNTDLFYNRTYAGLLFPYRNVISNYRKKLFSS